LQLALAVTPYVVLVSFAVRLYGCKHAMQHCVISPPARVQHVERLNGVELQAVNRLIIGSPKPSIYNSTDPTGQNGIRNSMQES
jgi:hypothetical protein